MKAVPPAPRTRKPISIKHPSPTALEYAEDVASRVYARPAPVRNGFVERFIESDPLPPLATIIRGGQGGEVRLKFLLSLLWFSAKHPHDTDYPARGWANLLGLDQADTNGARRVSAAIDWLEEHKFIRVVKQPGMPSTIFLLDERGNGDEYTVPFDAMTAKQEAGTELTRDDYYVRLPATFWTKGWIAVLSASAIAMLLVMLDQSELSHTHERLWHSPKMAKRRFGLSPDVRSAGLRELEAYNIVTMHRSSVAPGVFDLKRYRNVYDLHLDQLLVEPGATPPVIEMSVEEFMAETERSVAEKLESSKEVKAFRARPSRPRKSPAKTIKKKA